MAAKIGYLAIDTVDPKGLAPFWCGLLGVQVDTAIGEGGFLLLSPTDEGLVVGFQRVPEAKAGKNRVHLDLVVDDLDAATAEVEQLGGRWLEPGTTRELEGFHGAVWQILRATSSISISSPLTLSTCLVATAQRRIRLCDRQAHIGVWISTSVRFELSFRQNGRRRRPTRRARTNGASHDRDTCHRSQQGTRVRDRPATDPARSSRVHGSTQCPRGEAAATTLGGQFVQLDVTDDASVEAALGLVAEPEGHLDVLVNNAGISTVADVSGPEALRVFDTNVIGLIRVTQAALPLLERSDNPVVVNVSSALGSFWAVTNPDRRQFHFPSIIYGSSKAAVSMLTVQYAKTLPEIKFNAVEPGFTATDLTPFSGAGQPVDIGAEVIVRMATIDKGGPTGTFQEGDAELGW